MRKCIAVLTGGGDCPGLNAVLRAIVKTGINKYGNEIIGFIDGYRGLVENDYKVIKLNEVSGILDKGGTILGTSNKHNPSEYIVVEDGQSKVVNKMEQVKENLEKLNIDCLIAIGGDGTLNSAAKLHEMGVNVVGVPKTIDNDLCHTDLTFGFMTAVDTATEAIDKLRSTAESHHRVMILEVMGRYAGWIALESGIAGGADAILIPEIEYDLDQVIEQIGERKKQGKTFSLIVVAEGAKEKDGELVVSKVVGDSPDPIRLGGVGNMIADRIEKVTDHECRVTVLGHLQRGGRTSAFDRILSTRYGVAAIDIANQGNFGEMVRLQGDEITTVPIKDAVHQLKIVDRNGELVNLAKSLGVDFGD